MIKNNFARIIAIIALSIFMGMVAYPFDPGYKIWDLFTVPSIFTNYKFNLGLDLKGGTQLVYNIDLSDVPAEREKDVLSGVEEVIRRRVDGLGVAEPVIQTSSVGVKKHIIVELPGIKDINKAIELVGKVVQLQFKEEKTELTNEERDEIKKKNEETKKKADDLLKTVLKKEVPNLKNDSSTIKEAIFTEGKEAKSLQELDPILAEKIENSKDLKEKTIYPEVLETTDKYLIASIKTVENYTEKEVSVSHILVAFKGAERAASTVTRTKEEAFVVAKDVSSRLNKGEDFAKLSTEFSDDSVAKESAGELEAPVTEKNSPYNEIFTKEALKLTQGKISEPVLTPFGYHIIKAREVIETPSKKISFDEVAFKKEAEEATGWQNTKLTGEHFDFASASFDPNSFAPIVNIQFNDKGKDLFAEITEKNLNKPLAIFLDDEPIIGREVYAPTVQSKIEDGKAIITGLRSLEEASILAQNLNTGAIPAPISLIGQSTVEATLGQTALNQAIKAGIIGFIVLSLFLILYYRLSGLVAVLALIVYIILLSGIIKLIGQTLTLAGIAGVILSIGMAVDANVLIFERMKEEVQEGKDLRIATEDGFKRAWLSIRDSNASSLITCALLFIFGTGLIRGFAVTLAIGILVSLFSAITTSREFLKALINLPGLSEKPWFVIPFTSKKNN